MIHSFLSFFAQHYTEAWTIVGLVLVIAEMFVVPGVGLLFVGLGALSVALISVILPEIYEVQYIIFIITSLVWLIILWGPIKRYLYKKGNDYSVPALVGSKVKVVHNAIASGEIGQVQWSGTIMNAKLASDINIEVKTDSILKVVEVQGNVLICIPIQD